VRTTLTLEPDVAALVQQEAKRTGASFKATVNDLLRKGTLTSHQKSAEEKFEVTPLPMGLMPGLSYDSIPELLDLIEGPFRR